MEFRQLRYFATLAEELHFGRAASREHIVQSALSQQISRLERELGVPLAERSTHHVRLTAAGEVFLAEARQILDHLDRAKKAARSATASSSVLRVAVGDASFDSMPQVLQAVHVNHPSLEIHRIEACVPEQCRLLADRRLDVGFGRASRVPREVASEVLRLDRMGVLVALSHPLTRLESVPVGHLAGESLLLAEDARAPEFNEFISEICRSAGFTPTPYRGTVQSVRAAADLVAEGRCVVFVPRSVGAVSSGTRWLPLVDPVARYSWSLLWRADDRTARVSAVRDCARTVSRQRGWIETDDAELPALQQQQSDGVKRGGWGAEDVTLAPRDEPLARLDRASADLLADVPAGENRRALTAYATWRVLHRAADAPGPGPRRAPPSDMRRLPPKQDVSPAG